MCISAEVNFVASAIIGAVGVATLAHVRRPRDVLFGAMPLLFALHQFVEGFVWLGIGGTIDKLAFDNAAFLFLLYAQGILPIVMPLSVLLMEDVLWRRRALAAITALAFVFGAYMIMGVVSYPTSCYAKNLSIVYSNPVTETWWTALLYILVTCGALVLSGFSVVRWFGVLNLIGLTVVMIVKSYAFSSVWCFYAAVISVILYWQFRTGKIRPLPAGA
ncbi:DUF6629 family protein [Thalassococcus sp. BH17M4-6]|uniref:DUF6629 family protein n=1 Tax=Thalassococcus sp. BH17M4-6 TaxID=3413148 RepID=UPI003BDE6D38